MTDKKQGAMSISETAEYWSVSRGTAYAILRENPWIRVLAIYGSKRAVPVEDAQKYLARCKIVGISAKSGKIRSVEWQSPPPGQGARRHAVAGRRRAAPPTRTRRIRRLKANGADPRHNVHKSTPSFSSAADARYFNDRTFFRKGRASQLRSVQCTTSTPTSRPPRGRKTRARARPLCRNTRSTSSARITPTTPGRNDWGYMKAYTSMGSSFRWSSGATRSWMVATAPCSAGNFALRSGTMT